MLPFEHQTVVLSLQATSAPLHEPVRTESTVSYELPQVEMVTEPEAVGVHAQTSSGAPPPPQLAETMELPRVVPLTWLPSAGKSRGVAQVPQVVLHVVVRLTPQLSLAVTGPQPPTRAQKAASLSGVQAQTLSGPHATLIGHVPQSTERAMPQRSVTLRVPQFFPSRVQSSVGDSAQPQTFAVPEPPQLAGVMQVPQLTVLETPHASLAVTMPQSFPSRLQNAEFDSAQPQTFAVPFPPQVPGARQEPHDTLRKTPHASVAVRVPQFFWSRPHTARSGSVQPQTLAWPAPPHVAGPTQVPQFAVRVTPHESTPV